MRIHVRRKMYDPVADRHWTDVVEIEVNSATELKAKLAELDREHPRWTGEVPRG